MCWARTQKRVFRLWIPSPYTFVSQSAMRKNIYDTRISINRLQSPLLKNLWAFFCLVKNSCRMETNTFFFLFFSPTMNCIMWFESLICGGSGIVEGMTMGRKQDPWSRKNIPRGLRNNLCQQLNLIWNKRRKQPRQVILTDLFVLTLTFKRRCGR